MYHWSYCPLSRAAAGPSHQHIQQRTAQWLWSLLLPLENSSFPPLSQTFGSSKPVNAFFPEFFYLKIEYNEICWTAKPYCFNISIRMLRSSNVVVMEYHKIVNAVAFFFLQETDRGILSEVCPISTLQILLASRSHLFFSCTKSFTSVFLSFDKSIEQKLNSWNGTWNHEYEAENQAWHHYIRYIRKQILCSQAIPDEQT